ncbi:hypothetical protein SAMN05216223_10916 [Actinacidiphila yanglinensis]|uniref:Uncharacterized protein n=1 Tax=Actinacidiphila yanglinensis TaxID=310779 RepID=A0A1H6CJH2_9ACTN|nr:DUF6233 domain-containing protein [Actinacidiphila yanglinensis]SEG72556.1 hypothetical protein SAMN05216223_10916 [Actinacidiphila yanglinensis]
MSSEEDQEPPAPLPPADGPLVDVILPDGQHLYAVVKARRKEPDGTWWYDLQIHLPSQVSDRGRLLAVPAAIDFRAPADACAPIDGQHYDRIPTRRAGATPPWKIEEPVYFTGHIGPARIVHRGDCRAIRDLARPATTEQARAVLERDNAGPCEVCRPDLPLSTAA